jgi:glucose-6-phosphate 1-dehydrogenase
MDIAFRFITKKTGLEMDMQPADMVFDYDKKPAQSPEAYETLLLDAMRGDATLFMRADQVEEAWDVIHLFWKFGNRDLHQISPTMLQVLLGTGSCRNFGVARNVKV